ncbi:MAG: imidazole glycerol phosphate synthase subunit HisH, partial [Candidatus Hadarchaeales archaeon]
GLKVPHIGWDSVEVKRMHPIVRDVPSGSYMYFMHSYYVCPKNPDAIVATTNYGLEFPSIVASGSVVGVQFHPEKSGRAGMQVLRNFVEMVGSA